MYPCDDAVNASFHITWPVSIYTTNTMAHPATLYLDYGKWVEDGNDGRREGGREYKIEGRGRESACVCSAGKKPNTYHMILEVDTFCIGTNLNDSTVKCREVPS